MVVTPSAEPEAMLDGGAAIDEEGAAALELLDDPVELLPQAVRVSAAAAVRPIPAIRRLRTRIHSNWLRG
ncbi:hypothetical protein GCM10027258_40420 [Amycolatopsis stemonae]